MMPTSIITSVPVEPIYILVVKDLVFWKKIEPHM